MQIKPLKICLQFATVRIFYFFYRKFVLDFLFTENCLLNAAIFIYFFFILSIKTREKSSLV